MGVLHCRQQLSNRKVLFPENMNKMNSFFGYSVVEKLKFISFENERKEVPKEIYQNENVTNNKFKKKINDVKNEKIKKSLLKLVKVFKKR